MGNEAFRARNESARCRHRPCNPRRCHCVIASLVSVWKIYLVLSLVIAEEAIDIPEPSKCNNEKLNEHGGADADADACETWITSYVAFGQIKTESLPQLQYVSLHTLNFPDPCYEWRVHLNPCRPSQ